MSPVVAPSRLPDPVPKQMLSSPKVTSPDKLRFKVGEPRRPLLSPDGVTAARSNSNHPHPLSRPPITASTTSSASSKSHSPSAADVLPSPLPVLTLAPPEVTAMRRGLHRRRSSFPPAVGSSVTGANSYPWVVGGTPTAARIAPPVTQDSLSGYGNEIGHNSMSSPGAWESLLNFDTFDPVVKSDRPFEATVPHVKVEGEMVLPSPKVTPSKKSIGLERTMSTSEAWRLALNRSVEVEGVGRVGIARILSEVWKRGGPGSVTSQGLWPSILMSLSFAPEEGSAPSSPAAFALQALYNVAVRPHEAIVFAGLLSSYVASTAPPVVNVFQDGQVYGAWTPTKGIGEVELSQWTTFTPGEEWPSLSTVLPSGSGLTPRREFSPALGLPPIDISDGLRPESRGPGDGINGIEAILAEMEEDERLRESENGPTTAISQPEWMKSNSNEASPATAAATIDSDPFTVGPGPPSTASAASVGAEEPVENMLTASMASSPFVSGGSTLSATSASTTIPSVPADANETGYRISPTANTRSRPPQALQMPLSDVPFIPPPPMCMFFSPAFRDLQQGKVAVWKGDLVIRGRGGGRFNVLVIGEAASGALWQSHTWPENLTYPPEPAMTESYTATMIPVSTLAREGLLPVTMGMVLCNDADINPFVNMVQGLHAEGVAFHLPMPDSGLPIVFLPAKFDSADPLQRLGIAFMTKGGVPPLPHSMPPSRKMSAASREADGEFAPAPERKRRRKSTASSCGNGDPKPAAARRNVPVRPKATKAKS